MARSLSVTGAPLIGSTRTWVCVEETFGADVVAAAAFLGELEMFNPAKRPLSSSLFLLSPFSCAMIEREAF